MDWATQPNPFRSYSGVKSIELPLANNYPSPPYHLLDNDLPSAPLLKESLSQLLQFSMGIAAYKVAGENSWAVRCNASSGNLHPTETYVILPALMDGLNTKTSIYHYACENHSLEILSEFDTSFWDNLPKNSFIIGLSSITWREVWKYGERAFRYTQLDAGHAWQSIVVSAKMLGWRVSRLDSVSQNDMSILMGLNQKNRFFEDENPDMLLIISPEDIPSSLDIKQLVEDVKLKFEGIANKLSQSMQNWDIIPAIEDATSTKQITQKSVEKKKILRDLSFESKKVVLNRRSIHVMEKEKSKITKNDFHKILRSVSFSLDAKENSVHLAIFVHRIENYESGIYILIRNDRDKKDLQKQMKAEFLWRDTDLKNLYLLQESNYEHISKAISCSQDIASDGAFSLGMLCKFSAQLQDFGAHRYKELYWECGAIGQELYLEATSLELSGTGIGCFLDDDMHKILGIKDNRFQILYHFTVGRGHVDSRILTKEAYDRS